MNQSEVNSIAIRYRRIVHDSAKGCLVDPWLESYMAAARALPGNLPYGYQSEELVALDCEINDTLGKHFLAEFHKAALLSLIVEAAKFLGDCNYPTEVEKSTWASFSKIVDHIELVPGDDSNFVVPKDDWSPYWTYLGIAALKIIPVGLRIIIPIEITEDAMEFPNALADQHNKGEKVWFYFLHIHPQSQYRRGVLNREAYTDSLRLCALLLERNPQIRGLLGKSWFLDPVVADISPNLAFIPEVNRDVGAIIEKSASTDTVIQQATAVSATRRRLYEEGKYFPTGYAIFYPRHSLIKWAQGI